MLGHPKRSLSSLLIPEFGGEQKENIDMDKDDDNFGDGNTS